MPTLVPLAWFTGRRTIMGDFANGAGMGAVTVIVVVAIVALNMLLDTRPLQGERRATANGPSKAWAVAATGATAERNRRHRVPLYGPHPQRQAAMPARMDT